MASKKFEVNNLPSYYKNHKYLVVKDLRNDTTLNKRFRGYWFWGCYDTVAAAQEGVDEFRGTSIHAVIMDSETVVAI